MILPNRHADVSDTDVPSHFNCLRKPRRASRSNGALVIDDLPSRAGLVRRGSVIQAWIPPSHEVCQILMCSTRNARPMCCKLATRAVTPHQREAQYDYPAVSFFLRSLLILATAILEANGGCRSVRTRYVLTWKAWPSPLQGWTRKAACQGGSSLYNREVALLVTWILPDLSQSATTGAVHSSSHD